MFTQCWQWQKSQFTQVQDGDRKWSVLHLVHVASKHYALVLVDEGALINKANIQSGERA